MRRTAAILAFLLSAVLLTVALAQGTDEKSGFITFVEEKLSTPDRQIRLNGIEGTLSSEVSFASITIADKKGVWLEITKPKLVWTRSALFTGRLEIDSLTAEKIDVKRKPAADDSLPSSQARPFSVPKLPVAVVLKKLSVPSVAFGADVFGLKSEAGIDGKMTLDGGSLDLDLDIRRLDGPGGQLKAVAKYDGAKKTLALDVRLNEPEDGIVASLLGIENRPPVQVAISGNAPVDDLTVNLAFDVDNKRILGGEITLQGTGDGLVATAYLGGPLSSIMPERGRAFFGAESLLTADILFPEGGGVLVRDTRLESGNLRLAANAATQADGFLTALNVNFQMFDDTGARVTLPVEGNDISLTGAGLVLRYDAERRAQWDGSLEINDLRAGNVEVAEIGLQAGGTVTGLEDARERSVIFSLSGEANRISSKDGAVAAALGQTVTLKSDGRWRSGSATTLNTFSVAGRTFTADLTGMFADAAFDGSISLQAADLAAFSELAGRNLGGRIELATSGKVFPFTGGFDLDFDGQAQSLSLGDRRIDPLLAGQTRLLGGVARTAEGTRFRRFRLINEQVETAVDGALSSGSANILATARIADLGAVNADASGPVTMRLSITGQQSPFEIGAALQMPAGKVAGRSARDLALTFSGLVYRDSLKGDLEASGFVNDEAIALRAGIAAGDDELSLRDLAASFGPTTINGDVNRNSRGLFDGALVIRSSDIGTAAAVVLVKASGAIDGDVTLSAAGDGTQSATTRFTASGLVYDTIRVGVADVDAAVADLFGVPVIDAKASGSAIEAGGVAVESFEAKALSFGAATDFSLNAALAQNRTRISAGGQMTRNGNATRVALTSLQLSSNVTDARLRAPAEIEFTGGKTRISEVSLAVGNGSVTLAGTAGTSLDLNVGIESLPLAIANSVRPQTGAAGTVSGTVSITGSGQRPVAHYRMTGSGVSVRQIAELGLSPLELSLDGRFAGRVATIENARVTSADAIAVSISGQLPIDGAGVNLAIDGNAPLSLAQRYVASRGASVSGNAQFNAAITGSLAAPSVQGLVSVGNGTLTDPLTNLRLENIGLIAGLTGDRLSINRMEARLPTGGTITGSGTVTVAGSFPADISVQLTGARYTDGQTFSTTINGNLTVTGNLSSDPLLSGNLNLGRTEIVVPESFSSDANLLSVTHVEPSGGTADTLRRISQATPPPAPSARPSVLRLDLSVNAPSQIFVRGRGLDAELGGSIHVTGPVTNVVPLGRFELRRGRLSIVGQRLDLVEGTITLTGDLDPLLDFHARTSSDTVDAAIRLRGRASNLEVTFTSAQGLPEDEVLAGIIFGRRVSELTPFQVAKLASIAAELTGGSNVSLVERLRRGTGLDDLDVVQDDEGNTAVKAGKYVQDNVYLGVEAGRETEATINLDLTDNLRARGAVNSRGDTSLGIFFEKDY